MLKNESRRYDKTFIDSRITRYISSYLNIYPVIKKSFLCVSTTRRFYFTQHFFSVLLNIYISNIYNIYNPDKKMSLASQTICYHIFSDPKLGYTFHIFGYVPRLYFASSHMWKFSTYFKSRKVSKSTVSWFLIESNWIQPEYYFLTNTEKNSKYYLEKYSENSTD